MLGTFSFSEAVFSPVDEERTEFVIIPLVLFLFDRQINTLSEESLQINTRSDFTTEINTQQDHSLRRA
jgi:hypothetical protein